MHPEILNAYKTITSPQNSRIKELIKLKQPKYRRESGVFVVENLAIIYDALKDGFDFEALFVTSEFAVKNQEQLDFLTANSQAGEFYLIDSKTNKAYSDLSTPSGITALYKIKINSLSKKSVVYLAGVNDPGNLGTIMRNALAFGLENLVLSKECADPFSAKTISAAKDAIFKLNIFEDRVGDWLEKCALPIYATSSHEGRDLKKFQAAEKFCLVLGSESQGVPAEILQSADEKIKIVISKKIESLNVAAAAAILFYELQK